MKENIKLKCKQSIRLDIFLQENLRDYLKNRSFSVCTDKTFSLLCNDSRKEQSSSVAHSSPIFHNTSVSNSKIRRLIIAGAVRVNGYQIRIPSYKLQNDSTVEVLLDEKKFFYEKQPDDIHFELEKKDVLYEDDFLIVVNKPAFFPTEETIVGNRDNLHDAIVRYLWKQNPTLRNPPYVGIMHRLDRETSGAILFTKSRQVNKQIHELFDSSNPNHKAVKVYCAMTQLPPNLENVPKTFSVKMFMGRISSKSQCAKWGALSQDKGGVFSHTDFQLIKTSTHNGKNVLYVQATLFTGRTHQIRVHLSTRHLSIIGDTLYGGVAAERIMLHSQRLTFKHPITNEILKIESPLPF